MSEYKRTYKNEVQPNAFAGIAIFDSQQQVHELECLLRRGRVLKRDMAQCIRRERFSFVACPFRDDRSDVSTTTPVQHQRISKKRKLHFNVIVVGINDGNDRTDFDEQTFRDVLLYETYERCR